MTSSAAGRDSHKVISLLNVLYEMSVELTFENLYLQMQHPRWRGNSAGSLHSLTNIEILKSHLATQCTI